MITFPRFSLYDITIKIKVVHKKLRAALIYLLISSEGLTRESPV